MQKRLKLSCCLEIPRLKPEEKIGNEEGDGGQALGKILEIAGHQPEPRKRDGHQHDKEKRG